jgi:hypothetical protein
MLEEPASIDTFAIVQDILNTIDSAQVPLTATVGLLHLRNRLARVGSDTPYSSADVKHALQESLHRVVQNSNRRPGLLATIYDAVELKPEILGISIDLKRLLEALIPDIRERLSPIAVDADSLRRLRILVTSHADGTATRNVVRLDEVRRSLGGPLVEAMLRASFVRPLVHRGIEYVELTHDILAMAIAE